MFAGSIHVQISIRSRYLQSSRYDFISDKDDGVNEEKDSALYREYCVFAQGICHEKTTNLRSSVAVGKTTLKFLFFILERSAWL